MLFTVLSLSLTLQPLIKGVAKRRSIGRVLRKLRTRTRPRRYAPPRYARGKLAPPAVMNEKRESTPVNFRANFP